MTTADILTILLIVFTAIYAFLTFLILRKNAEMVAQMKAQHESFIAPVVNTALGVKHGSMMCLSVTNTGQAPARNLRLTLDRDFHQFGKTGLDNNIKQFPIFQERIAALARGEELFIMLVQGHEMNDLTPSEFAIDLHYEFGGKSISERRELSLRPYMRTSQNKPELLHEIEKIRAAFETIAGQPR
jgi:hypothetical protein